ncbi:MAG: polysaccharide biosynthesis/export family protein [Chlamydiales bacterium]|nr:polysaccharide biosynthesis/export family protein [Chlamydiales bacterium]
MQRFFLPLIFLISLSACSTRITDEATHQVSEFVLDSHKIQQGKFSILELQGEKVLPLSTELLEEYKDTLTEDDVLNITLYHPSRKDLVQMVNNISQSIGFRVSEGKVSLPDIGYIEVSGLTLEQARQKIQQSYLEQISDVDIFLDYKKRLKRKVELAGLVSTSEIPVDGKLRLYEALGKARIPTEANLFKSYILRNNQPLKIDFNHLILKGDMQQNIVLKEGDKIYIASPTESTVLVTGEVLKPSPIPLNKGAISLRDALIAAGGLNYLTASENAIYVIRGNIVDPKIYMLNWKQILHLRNDSLLLIPGDTVYVASKPIAEWNRFINLLLPSFSGLQEAGAAYGAIKR